MDNLKLYNGNCLDVLKNCPDNYMDSIVTDPPYGLSFMGKKWDYDVPSTEIWKECLRVLKPGGHLLAFGGTRTYHRLVVAIEDAGFEIRDQIQWIYGQGFPKSQDISKAIDKAAGAERTEGAREWTGGQRSSGILGENHGTQTLIKYDTPATPDAQKWSGWGTALKPANEPICLARKPLSESTIAKNVLKHGTGGLNIDGTRIDSNGEKLARPFNEANNEILGTYAKFGNPVEPAGRFPSNVILDEDAAQVLDGQSGVSKSNARPPTGKPKYTGSNQDSFAMKASSTLDTTIRGHEDSGGASRFFYVAKASKADRGADNTHPTVKPIKLMEYLIKLVTPEGGVVLDPFMGSGTTGVAALRNGFKFRGIEMNEEYFKICEARISQVEK